MELQRVIGIINNYLFIIYEVFYNWIQFFVYYFNFYKKFDHRSTYTPNGRKTMATKLIEVNKIM